MRALSAAIVLSWVAACTRAPTEAASESPPDPRTGGDALAPSPMASLSVSAPSRAVDQPSRCPSGMVFVDGAYCANLEQVCLRHRKPWQCAEFKAPSRCAGEALAMQFCIDQFEYPNERGALPVVMSSWRDAKAKCEAQGKRLCTEAEWTLACEGPERLPFPYGYARDAGACSIDKKSPHVKESRLFNPTTRDDEVARLDQREPSGSRDTCVSAYGVYDLTGNVDEWVRNESGRPHQSALKGGNWGEYRNACRPATRGHDEGFYYYQTGFRCCQEAGAGRSDEVAP
jgi:formylglycine-generating enzyme